MAEQASRQRMRERYGVVLAMAVVALIVTIAMPTGQHTGAAVLALQGAVLMLSLRAAPPASGGHFAQIAAAAAVVAGLAAALGGLPGWLVLTTSAIFLTTAIAVLARGALHLLRTVGVTTAVVAAALAIYVILGLLFATIIGAVAGATHGMYFAQGTDGSQGDRVYFSFAVLSTTGFGDFTPALPVGRALSVAEMLIGQIYLVTIVGLLVGNLRRPAPGSTTEAEAPQPPGTSD